MTTPALDEWFAVLQARYSDQRELRDEAHRQLRDAGWLSRVTLHRYMCRRGCQIAVVFKIAGRTLCAVRDYKQSPGLNQQRSVPAARRNNTLDGDRHWPAMVYDVEELVDFGGMHAACRHYTGTLIAGEVLRTVADVTPGRPGAPTRL